MILTYEAIDADGRQNTDAVEAADPREAVELLRRRGLFVTRIEEGPKAKAEPTLRAGRARSRGMPLKTLVLFTRQMGMLLRAGSGVVPAMTAIKRQMKKPDQVVLLDRIVADLEEGNTLTDAFRRHPSTFDASYCAIVAAGEASGALDKMFERPSMIVGKRRAMRKKIMGALAYPAMLIVMCVSILLVLLLFVLPRFAGMFEQLGVDAPATTKVLLATGAMVREHWLIGLGLVAGMGFLTSWLLTSDRGRQWLTDVQLNIPLIGGLRSRLIQGQILRTLGSLLESGVGLLEALGLARESTRNARFRRLFNNLEVVVTSGGQPSTAFEESGLVEPYICQAVRTGEDSGNLGGALTYCADILDETNEELVGVVTRLIEPIILIGMGLVVGFVAISLFLPLFDLTSAIQ